MVKESGDLDRQLLPVRPGHIPRTIRIGQAILAPAANSQERALTRHCRKLIRAAGRGCDAGELPNRSNPSDYHRGPSTSGSRKQDHQQEQAIMTLLTLTRQTVTSTHISRRITNAPLEIKETKLGTLNNQLPNTACQTSNPLKLAKHILGFREISEMPLQDRKREKLPRMWILRLQPLEKRQERQNRYY